MYPTGKDLKDVKFSIKMLISNRDEAMANADKKLGQKDYIIANLYYDIAMVWTKRIMEATQND